jgi:hypothetical protein
VIDTAQRAGLTSELVHRWLEDAARCDCPSLDDCPLFEPTRLPERPVALA